MADVQTENGYTRIANELMEVISKQKFNGTQFRILLVIIRYTYGFKRKHHNISLSFISKATDVHKQQVKKEVDKLIEEKVISVIENSTFSQSRKLGINKDYSKWFNSQSTDKQTVSELTDTTVSELTDTTVSEFAYQEIKTKENIKETAFNEFWAIYRKKVKKAQSQKKFEVQLKKHGKEKIIHGAKCYMDEKKDTDKKYILDPTTFLNQQVFLDYEDEEKTPSKDDEELKKLLNRKKYLEAELSEGKEAYEVFGNLHVYEFHKKELREINERLRDH